MFLAFNIADIIRVPCGWLLNTLYQLTESYGLALIIFAVLIKIILFPASAKSKKSTMKMSRMAPKVQALQKKYGNDQQKLNEATQALYKEEGVSMGGGCLWSLLPLLILIPLFTVIRQPLDYMFQESESVVKEILRILKEQAPSAFSSSNTTYEQVFAVTLIPQYRELLQGIEGIKETTLAGMNFDFLGINLGLVPDFKIWAWEAFNWATIGSFLLPFLSAGSQVLSMIISQKMNNSVITNEKGLEDKETAKNSQANQSAKVMMWMMPLMSVWIGFTVPGALSIYWFVQGIISLIIDVILTKHYRKIYDEEDAIRLQLALEAEKAEAEKERIRAERRAANPDGITQNTSKKKLQQKQQREEEAAKAAAKKEYDAKKGIVQEAEETVLSGISDRPYCKGRNYDPNRYSTHTEE